MGRQYRPPRRGGVHGGYNPTINNVGPTSATSSSVATVIPNYGFTNIGSTANYPAGEYVLDAPSEGIVKTIVCATTSSDARIIRLSTGNTVSVNTQPVTTGSGGNTQITFNATVSQVVTLLGVNSTHWAVISMWPPTAANSTGVVIAST